MTDTKNPEDTNQTPDREDTTTGNSNGKSKGNNNNNHNNDIPDSTKFWQKIADEEYSKRKADGKPDNSVLGQFMSPLLPPVVHVMPVIPHSTKRNNTARFDFIDNKTYVSSIFMDKLVEDGGVEKRTAMRGILKHEVGHYVDYPRECDVLIFLGHIAEKTFEKTHEEVLAQWVDVKDNLHQFCKGESGGREIGEVYKGFNRMLEQRLELSQEEQDILRAFGNNPDEIMKAAREYSVDRLIYAYYQRQWGEDFGVRIEKGEYLYDKLNELLAIKYIPDEDTTGKRTYFKKEEDEKNDTVNFILFGQIITDVLNKRRENMPKIKFPSGKGDKESSGEDDEDQIEGMGGEGEGEGEGNSDENDDDKEEGEGDNKGRKGKRGKGKGSEDGDEEDKEDKDGSGGSSDKKDKERKEREGSGEGSDDDKDKENDKGKRDGKDKDSEKNRGMNKLTDDEKRKIVEDALRRLREPILKDAPDLRDFSDKQISEGLDKIIRKYGKFRYERIRDYVERATGRKFDMLAGDGSGSGQGGKLAGLGKSGIKMHDEEIPYYQRKASTYGLYIHKKPIVSDVFNSYPEGTTVFRVGDPIKTLNPFSTGGLILPGITKRYKLKQGHKRDRQYKIPHLLIVLDTSGSMTEPTQSSLAVLASYILARNYYENGASVGVINFSTDLAMLPPTRDINAVYSMLCAYWGGGTVLNHKKIMEYVKRIADENLFSIQRLRRSERGSGEFPQGHEANSPYVLTTEQDYEDLIKGLHPDERKQFEEKSLTVNLKDRKIKETYESIDTVMITDGYIWNIEEFVDFINTTGKVTRNIIYLINNRGGYKELKDKTLPNTQIIPIDKPEDLIGHAIGRVKTLVPAEPRPASLFYRG